MLAAHLMIIVLVFCVLILAHGFVVHLPKRSHVLVASKELLKPSHLNASKNGEFVCSSHRN